jgi:integrase/recombinase XerD
MILPAPLGHLRPPFTALAGLAELPQEQIWLAKQKSARTRRAYRLDVQHFMRTLGITAQSELRQVDHRAVIDLGTAHAGGRARGAIATIRRRLPALSSLFKHLVRHGHAARNPVTEVERRRSTPTKAQRSRSRLACSR